MKKMLMALVLIMALISGVCAYAEELALPEITEYFPDDIEFVEEIDSNMRMYYAADSEKLIEDIALYSYYLFDGYGFDNLGYDIESSDTFEYLYISTYNGSADIEKEYIDECSEPCYILFALAGYEDGAILVVCTADGISMDGEATAAASADTTTYTAPIAGNDGLLVMPMEECFSGITRSYMYVDDNYYGYRYIEQGRYYDGEGSDEYREMYVDYVDALVDSGYYTLIEHSENSLHEIWCLGYTGNADLEEFRVRTDQTDDAVIIIQLLFEDGYVYYSQDIATTNLEEAAEASGLLNGSSGGGSSSSYDNEKDGFSCPRCYGHGKSTCTTCWGTGQVDDSSMSSGRSTCRDCRGMGNDTCDYCDGSGWID